MKTSFSFFFKTCYIWAFGLAFGLSSPLMAACGDAADAGSDIIVCDQFGGNIETLLAANAPSADNTGTWSIISGAGGVFDDVNDPGTKFTGAQGIAFTLRWTITDDLAANAVCTTDDVIVHFVSNPDTANAGADQIGAGGVCGTGAAATLAGNATAAGIGTWTQTAGPGTSIFADANSATSTVTVDTEGTYTFTWTTTNSPCLASADAVDIEFFDDLTVAAAGPDQTGGANICDIATAATMAGNAAGAGETGTWTQTSGPGTATFVTPTSETTDVSVDTAGTYVFTWSISGGAGQPCVDTTDTVSVEWVNPPTVSAAGADQTGAGGVCGLGVANTATLAANVPVDGTGVWSQVAGSGVAVFSDVNSATSTVSAPTGFDDTYTFRWTISNPSCADSTDDVDIQFFRDTTVSTAGADQNVCGMSAFMGGNAAGAGEVGTWTQISGPGTVTFADANSETTNATADAFGSYVLRWTMVQTGGPCADTTDDVTIAYFDNPTAAAAGADQTGVGGICGVDASATMAGNAPAVGTGAWTQVAGPGTAVFADAASETSTVTVDTVGTYTFRWTTSNGPCPTSTDDVSVEWVGAVTEPDAGSDQVVCFVPFAKLAPQQTILQANGPNLGAGETGLWTIECNNDVDRPGDPAGSFDDATNPNAIFTGQNGGLYTLRWTITPAAAPCVAVFDDVTIAFPPNPSGATAGPDDSVCGLAYTLAATALISGTGTWTSSVAGATFAPDANDPTATVTLPGGSFGTATFTWTVLPANLPNSGGCTLPPGGLVCPGGSDTVDVTFVDDPTVANAGADQTGVGNGICGLTSSLAGNAAVVGVGTWTQTAGPGTSTFVDANDPTTSTTVTVEGSYTFRWTIANAPCADSFDEVSIEYFDTVTAAAGADIDDCANPMMLEDGNAPALAIPDDGTDATDTINVADLGAGIFPNAATITDVQVFVDIDHASTSSLVINLQHDAGTDVNLYNMGCSALDGSMEAGFSDDAPGPICNFYAPDTIEGGFTPASALSAFDTETVTGNWNLTITDQDNDAVTGTLNSWAIRFTLSSGTVVTLAGNAPARGTGTWTEVTGDGNGVFTDPNDPTTTFTGTTGTAYSLRWSITGAEPCIDSQDDVDVDLFKSDPANAGDDIDVCEGVDTTATLAANDPTASGSTGTWTITGVADGAGIFTSTGTNTSTTFNDTFTGTFGQTYTLQWDLTGGPCGASNDSVDVNFRTAPAPTAAAGDDNQVCAIGVGSQSTILEANTPTNGTGSWSIVSATPVIGGVLVGGETFSSLTSPTATFTGTAGIQYVLEWAIFNGDCETTDQVTIEFISLDLANAGPDQTVCADTTTLTANAPTIGTGTWEIISGAGGAFSDASAPNSEFTGAEGTTYTLRWNLVNGICLTFDNITVTFKEQPIATATDQDVCGDTTTLDGGHNGVVGTIPTFANGTWTITGVADGAGVLADPTNPTTAFSGTIGQTYTLRWEITNPPCTDSFVDVNIQFVTPPTTPDAGVDDNICAGVYMENTFAPDAIPDDGATSFTDTITVDKFGTVNDVAVLVDIAHADVSELTITLTNGSRTVTLMTAEACGAVTNGDRIFNQFALTNVGCPFDPGFYAPTAGSLNDFIGDNLADSWTLTVTDGSAGNAGTITKWALIIDEGQSNLSGNTPVVGTGEWRFATGGNTDNLGYFENPGQLTSAIENPTFFGSPGQTYTIEWAISNVSCTLTDEKTVTFGMQASQAVAGADQQVCADNTVLAATAPTMGTGAWTEIGGDGNGVFSDATSPTSTFTGTRGQTYDLRWTVSNGVCAPAGNTDDVQIIFDEDPTVAAAGADQTPCAATGVTMAGNTPTVGVGQWTIVSGDGNGFFENVPGTLTSNDPTAEFDGTGGQSYVLRWTISNGVCTDSTDDVNIIFYEAPTVAAAGADQYICGSNTALAGNAPAGDETGTWTFVTTDGNASFSDVNSNTATLTGTRGFAYTARWTIDKNDVSNTCPPSTDDVLVQFFQDPSEAFAGDNINQCVITAPADLTVTLTANTPSIGLGYWTIAFESTAGGTFADQTSPTTTFTAPAIGDYTLRWNVFTGNPDGSGLPIPGQNPCTEQTALVQLNYVNPPTTAAAGADQSVCADNVALAGNAPAFDEDGLWTVESFTRRPNNSTAPAVPVTAFSDDDSPTSTFTGTRGFDYVLRWSISVSNDTCPPSTDDVNVSLVDDPTVANAGADTDVCGLTTTLAGNTAAVGVGTWTGSGPGTITFDAANSETSGVTVDAFGTYTFTWTIDNAPCASTTDSVSYTFQQDPTVAAAGADDAVCGDTVTLAANTPTVGTGAWSEVTGDGSGVFTDASSATSGFTGTQGVVYVLRWTISNGVCTPSTDDVSINLALPPTAAAAGADFSFCGDTVTLAANAPTVGTGVWSVVTGDGAGSFANTSSPTSTFTGTRGQTYTLRWTISNDPCVASSDDVDVTLDLDPTTPTAGADQILCGFSATLAGNTITTGTGTWTSTGTGTFAPNANTPGAVYTDPFNNADNLDVVKNLTLSWTAENGVCSQSDDMSLNLVRIPLVDAGSDQFICGTTTSLNAASDISDAAPGVTYEWEILVDNPAFPGVILNNTSPTSTFNGARGFTYVLQWRVTNQSECISTDEVEITFSPLAVAGDDQELCDTESAQLAANPLLTGEAGLWTVAPAGGTFSNATSPTSTFTAPAGETYTLTWTVTAVACPDPDPQSSDSMTVTVYEAPSAAEAGVGTTMCLSETYTLGATVPAIGNGTWSIVDGPSTDTGQFSNVDSATSGFSPAGGVGLYRLQWSVGNGTCTATTDIVEVNVGDPAPVALAGPDHDICGDTATLAGNAPIENENGQWTITSGAGGTLNDPTDPASGFTGVRGESYTLTWTITNTFCLDDISDSDTVTINLVDDPTVANAGADQVVCVNTAVTLAANTATVGSGLWSIISGPSQDPAQFNDLADPTTDFTADGGPGNYILAWTISNDPCDPTSDQVTVEVEGLGLDTTPSQAQGLTTISLNADAICPVPSVTVEWINLNTGVSFGLNVNPVVLDPAPLETTDYQVTVIDDQLRTTQVQAVTILIADDPTYQDPNGDGVNDENDLLDFLLDWNVPATESTLPDANGDGFINILDLLYIP